MNAFDKCEVLRYAREWLRDEAHWTRRALYRDANGHETELVATTGGVASTCAFGACDYADFMLNGHNTDASSYARDAIKEACREQFGYGVITMNDERGEYDDVLTIFDKAITDNCNGE